MVFEELLRLTIIFATLPRKLWGGEFWEDGYFARTVGDKVTAEVIRKYFHRHKEAEDAQIDLFE